MDRNQQAASYLALLANLEQEPGVAFKSQLVRIRLDFSLASLAAIDEMLRGLRKSLTMPYGDFLEKQPAVNFVVALNFYIGTTIARCGNFALKWIDHQQALQFMPDLPARLETDVGCVIGEGLYFPANVVTEMLFDPAPQRTCSSLAASITEGQKGNRLPDPVPRPTGERRPPQLSAVWLEALEGAGFLGAWGIAEVAAGVQPKPMALLPAAAGKRTLVDFGTFGHGNLQDAIEDGMGRLHFNPEGAAWQALYYDGFANLPTGRRDALVVELRVYGSGGPGAQKPSVLGGLLKSKAAAPARVSLSLTVALPYRPASQPGGFANFAPRLVDCSYKGAEVPDLLDTFYRGIYTAKHFAWDQHYSDE